MPREWRSSARSAGSRGKCAADPPGLLTDVTAAFVDRTPIDWTALLARVHGSPHRDLFETLAFLDAMRAPVSAARAPLSRTRIVIWLIVLLAGVQTGWTLCAAGIASTSAVAIGYWTPQTAIASAFAAGSVLLAAAAARDVRGFVLLAAFASAASAFARPAAAMLPDAWSAPPGALFHGLFPEAFTPALLWQFALDFPRARRFTSFDVLARRAAVAAWTLGMVLFAVNLAIAYGIVETGPAILLGRHHPDGVFWRLFTLAVVPAIAAMLVRSRRAPAAERRTVARFAYAIAAGTSPFLLYGIARIALPGVDRWFAAAAPSEHLWLDHLIIAGLASVPMLGTAAVVLDRPFGLGAFVSRRVRQRVVRHGLTAAACAPFLVLAVTAYVLRDAPLTELLAGPRAWLLLGSAAAGCVILVLRSQLIDASGLGAFGRVIRHDLLTRSLERMRVARGSREISRVLRSDLKQGTGAAAVEILVPDRGGAFLDPLRRGTPLDVDAVLVSILAETTGPLDCSADGPVFHLLPPKDREWLRDRDLQLAAALKRRDGSIAAVAVLGRKRRGRAFDVRDRWLVTTLLTAAAAAWDFGDISEAASSGSAVADRNRADRSGEAAYECRVCGVVQESIPLRCGCAGDPILAALPRHFGRTLVVERRLGAGGMGVVYLARDTALNRDVALKTLPDLRGGVERLRREARAMAALNHESLETIYGLELWRLTPVLVVEYFPGGTLARRLAQGSLPSGEAIDIGIALARALVYMHSGGVLHRDLKPGNIGFTSAGAPKLLDFGLVSLTGSSSSDGLAADFESSTGCAGTPEYLPPEAYGGTPPSQAFDLWALSVVIAQAATGLDPVSAQRRENLVRGGCPAALIAFVERALAWDPGMRFSTSREFLAALELVSRHRDQ